MRWTFDEIAKMSPGGARTHDLAATLSKLQPNLGIQVTATRCTSMCTYLVHSPNANSEKRSQTQIKGSAFGFLEDGRELNYNPHLTNRKK